MQRVFCILAMVPGTCTQLSSLFAQDAVRPVGRGARHSAPAAAASDAAGAVRAPPQPSGMKRPRGSNMRWDVPPYGWITWDENRNALDAHCACKLHEDRKNACRAGRTCKAGPRGGGAQGRPLGLLVQWLRAPHRATKQLHTGMLTSDQTLEDFLWFSYENRCAARDWARLNGLAECEGIESHEDRLRPSEPRGIA